MRRLSAYTVEVYSKAGNKKPGYALEGISQDVKKKANSLTVFGKTLSFVEYILLRKTKKSTEKLVLFPFCHAT